MNSLLCCDIVVVFDIVVVIIVVVAVSCVVFVKCENVNFFGCKLNIKINYRLNNLPIFILYFSAVCAYDSVRVDVVDVYVTFCYK